MARAGVLAGGGEGPGYRDRMASVPNATKGPLPPDQSALNAPWWWGVLVPLSKSFSGQKDLDADLWKEEEV